MKKLVSVSFLILAGLVFPFNNSAAQTGAIPAMDLHVHLGYPANATAFQIEAAYSQASALSSKLGVTFGIAEEFGTNDYRVNDQMLLNRIALAKKYSMYLGLQVSNRNWQGMFSKSVISQADYILADAMVFPNKQGRIVYIWVAGQPLGETQEFMELYIAHNLKVLAEPINVWGNPTYLPDNLYARYDELWTDERMNSLIDAAVKNNVAVEINSRFRVPNAKFIKLAKSKGAHFTLGTNQHGTGIGEIEWSVKMAQDCGLVKSDFFVPKRDLGAK